MYLFFEPVSYISRCQARRQDFISGDEPLKASGGVNVVRGHPENFLFFHGNGISSISYAEEQKNYDIEYA